VRITPEVLALFLELENMSQRSQKFKDGSHQLARLLGLVDEWWSGCHANNRTREPSHPPEYIAHEYWHRCRAVRAKLLAATGGYRAAGADRRLSAASRGARQ
jgi:hypothetical protein